MFCFNCFLIPLVIHGFSSCLLSCFDISFEMVHVFISLFSLLLKVGNNLEGSSTDGNDCHVNSDNSGKNISERILKSPKLHRQYNLQICLRKRVLSISTAELLKTLVALSIVP